MTLNLQKSSVTFKYNRNSYSRVVTLFHVYWYTYISHKNWRPIYHFAKLSKYANGLILRYMLLDCRNKLIKPSRSYVKDKLPFSKLVDNFTIGFIHYAWINYLWYHIFFLFLTFSCMWPSFIWRVFLWKRAFENIWLVKYTVLDIFRRRKHSIVIIRMVRYSP